MAHKTLIDGTSYEISGGKTLVGGTEYEIPGGRTLIGGTGYAITVAVASDCTITISGGSLGGGTTQNTCYTAYVLYKGSKYKNTSIVVPAGESIEINLVSGDFFGAGNLLYTTSPRVAYEYTKADGTLVSYTSPYYYSYVLPLTIEADTTITFSTKTNIAYA